MINEIKTTIKIFKILFFMMFIINVNAQEGSFCGTSGPDSLEATQLPYFGNNEMLLDILKTNNYKFDGSQNRVNTTNDGINTAQWRVPVKIWITRRDDGTDGMAESVALTRIEQLNDQFNTAGTNIQFYALCDIDFIDDDTYHEIQNFNTVDLTVIQDSFYIPEIINLYFVSAITDALGFAQRPDETPNLIAFVERTAPIGIVSHEIGHTIGLLHTHYGGRQGHWTSNTTGNPINNGETKKCYQESVDRQKGNGFPCDFIGHLKCSINGDFLCDTEADPELSLTNVTNCAYSGGDEDNWNDPWTPDCSNIMSYAPAACLNTFTPMQIAVMIAGIQSRIPGSYQLISNNFDVYEPDDLALNANEILMSTPQYHTFHWSPDGNGGFEACDVDWLNYSTVGTSGNFTIRTYGQGFWSTPNTILTGFQGQTDDDATPFTGLSFLRLMGVPTGQNGFTIEVENKSAHPHPDSHGHYGIVIEDCNDCCPNGHFYKVPTLNSNTGSYNTAALGSQWAEAISEDLNVAGVDLSFNRNIPRHYVNYNTALPFPNSILEAKICNNATVEMRNNSTIEIGAATTNRTANLRIKSGSSLILKSGSTLRINNNSRLVVESGGTLFIEPGVDIELDGNNAILEIDGLLELDNNAIFSFSGSGRIIMGMPTSGPRIICGTNSEIHLSGANPTDLILEIKDNASLRPEPSLKYLNIEDGMVLMGNNAYITTANAGFRLEDLDIRGSTPNTVHRGIFVNGQSNHILNRIDLRDGIRGITAYQYWNQGSSLNASHLDISNCDIGLLVYGKGTYLNACDFHDNRIGYQHELPTFNSTVNASDFSQNEDYGVYFNNASGDLRAKNCEFDQNGLDGIRFSGNATFAPSCGSANNNGLNGIYLGMYSRLFMDNSYESQGAGMNVVGNPISIKAALAKDIYLNDGKNDIKSLAFNGGHRDINGKLFIFNSSPISRFGTENHWNDRSVPCIGKSPSYGTDYQLTGITNIPIYYTDVLRFCPPAMCSTGPGDDGGGDGMNRMSPKSETIITTKSFQGVALSQAINIATNEMEMFDDSRNDLLALTLFHEILNYKFEELDDVDRSFLDLAYGRMLTAFHHACTTGKISTNPKDNGSESKYYMKLLMQASDVMNLNAGESIEVNQFLIDQALTLHTLGMHKNALETLGQINIKSKETIGVAEQQKALEYYTCMISIQDDVLSGKINFEDIEDYFYQCQMSSGKTVNIENRTENNSVLKSSEINIYPNPTKDLLNIEILAKTDGQIGLELYDIQGRQMIETRTESLLSGNTSKYQINVSNLSEGMYFVRLKIDEKYYFHKVFKQ